MTQPDHLTEEDVRLEKLTQLRETSEHAFPYTYIRSHTTQQLTQLAETLNFDDPCPTEYSVAGRVIARRGHGKAGFGNLLDHSGTLQYYINQSVTDPASFDQLMAIDIGDIIGISGTLFKTQRGELSLKVKTATLLTKALKPLPEKYHGLQDKELRYRYRYVDLIANQDVKKVFSDRSDIIRKIRNFLHDQEFIEVETPVLQQIYGGAAARPFKTHHNDLDQDLFLRISLELPLKKLIVGGFEKIFELGRVFRNEGVSFKHNPEYTLLELYQAYADYTDMMSLTENLLSYLVKSITGSYTLTYQGTDIDFTPPFKRLTLSDALKTYANVDMDSPLEELRATAQKLGLDISDKPLKGQLINYIYDKAVEPHLQNPVFIMDYPWETSPLAKKHRTNPTLAERFELIINKMEIANSFSELNDPIDQRSRFEDQQKAKEAGDEEAHPMDEDYINALKYGLPPTGGLGIGIDRVVMLLTNAQTIRDVLFFPHMREKQL